MKDAKILTKEEIQDIENIVGYTFNNKALLEQAFIKNDYVNEHKEEQSSEVIEYYGDRALEISVTKELFKRLGKINGDGRYETIVPKGTVFGRITEGTLTNFRNSIVSTTPLSERIKELSLEKYMLMGGEKNKYEGISYSSKTLADLFESICGAIAIDCNWNNEVFEKHTLSFLDFENLYTSTLDFHNTNQFFENWYYDKFEILPDCHIERGFAAPDEVTGELCIPGEEENMWFDASGRTEADVINDLYSQAYRKLFVEKEVYRLFPEDLKNTFKESWFNPTIENSINIVQEMEQKGIIESTKYDFKEVGNDENGDPLWECTLNYVMDKNCNGHITCRHFKTKSEAKKNAAYTLVLHVFEYYNYHIERRF